MEKHTSDVNIEQLLLEIYNVYDDCAALIIISLDRVPEELEVHQWRPWKKAVNSGILQQTYMLKRGQFLSLFLISFERVQRSRNWMTIVSREIEDTQLPSGVRRKDVNINLISFVLCVRTDARTHVVFTWCKAVNPSSFVLSGLTPSSRSRRTEKRYWAYIFLNTNSSFLVFGAKEHSISIFCNRRLSHEMITHSNSWLVVS